MHAALARADLCCISSSPGVEVARETPLPRETVMAFLRRSGWATRDRKYGWQFKKGLPTILEINGEAVLRRDWRRKRIAANDNVRFVSYPLGGNGNSKQIIGLVALVAIAAFAAWAGPAAAALIPGLSSGAVTAVGSAFAAGIGLGGNFSVDVLEK
jgi:sulfur carrier protein ThiS